MDLQEGRTPSHASSSHHSHPYPSPSHDYDEYSEHDNTSENHNDSTINDDVTNPNPSIKNGHISNKWDFITFTRYLKCVKWTKLSLFHFFGINNIFGINNNYF